MSKIAKSPPMVLKTWLKMVPYFYIYGDKSDVSPTSHHSTAEAAVLNNVFNNIGGDVAI